jgi:hypothetical protein
MPRNTAVPVTVAVGDNVLVWARAAPDEGLREDGKMIMGEWGNDTLGGKHKLS